jgi:hypothetical protein
LYAKIKSSAKSKGLKIGFIKVFIKTKFSMLFLRRFGRLFEKRRLYERRTRR